MPSGAASGPPGCGKVVDALYAAVNDPSARRRPAGDAAPSSPSARHAVALGFASDAGCAVLEGGEVACWGVPGTLLGESEDASSFARAPALRAGLTDIAEVALGGAHACVRSRGGDVSCFGWNELGQVGNGEAYPNDPGDFPHPELPTVYPVPAASPAVALCASASHSCAALRDGKVACWGYSEHGESGGTRALSRRPTVIAGASGATAVACGSGFSCALGAAGAVTCWGDHGQLGEPSPSGDGEERAPRQPEARPVAVPSARALAAQGGLVCALARDGKALACWGPDRDGLRGEAEGRESPTVTLGLPRAADALAVGAGPCVRFDDGTVGCAGELGRALARDPSASGAAFALVPGVAGARTLAAGGRQGCALGADGALTCWGRRLDLAEHALAVPALALEGGEVQALAAADGRTCALAADGRVSCWGTGPSRTGFEDRRPAFLPGVTAAVDVAVGPYGQICAVLATGGVSCAGIGTDAAYRRDGDALAPLAGLPATRHVAVGAGHACVVGAGGEVWCWGENYSGQADPSVLPPDGDAGDPPEDRPSSSAPRRVAGVPSASAVALGRATSCALAADGGVWCWGNNREGLTGTGAFGRTAPVGRVKGVAGAVSLGAGEELACARLGDGGVACWGAGAFTAIPFDGIADAVDLGVGSDEACIARADGSVECGVPGCHAAVPGVTGALRVAVGEDHACAALRGGRVVCWGARTGSQLGDVPDFDPYGRPFPLP
ncbi:MAG: hypothetical protein HY908_28470 [Myxococcales bacterium]|nr:hypothetical protein [Myxococcales bacterium]